MYLPEGTIKSSDLGGPIMLKSNVTLSGAAAGTELIHDGPDGNSAAIIVEGKRSNAVKVAADVWPGANAAAPPYEVQVDAAAFTDGQCIELNDRNHQEFNIISLDTSNLVIEQTNIASNGHNILMENSKSASVTTIRFSKDLLA